MTPLPKITGPAPSGAGLEFTLDLSADLPVFDGHFPETPIVPAVAQIDWAMRLASEHFPVAREFKAAHSLKFLRLIQPPVTLSLVLTPASGQVIAFRYFHRGISCSSGRLEFADDASGPDRSLL